MFEYGNWGYYDADLNKDCYVDLKDLAVLGQGLLTCTDPLGEDCQIWNP